MFTKKKIVGIMVWNTLMEKETKFHQVCKEVAQIRSDVKKKKISKMNAKD